MAKDKLKKMGDGRFSYTFGNNTTVFLSKKPNKKIKNELKTAFTNYRPSKSKKNLSSTFGKFNTLEHIIQNDPKAPKKYMAFRSRQKNIKTGQRRQVIITTKGMFE
jgi:hypothetical protein